MTGKGTATLDFGAFPGRAQASASIAGQTGIAAGSYVEAWAGGDNATVDHSAEEHAIEDFRITADAIVPNTGFTLRARPDRGRCYGQYKFNYVWST